MQTDLEPNIEQENTTVTEETSVPIRKSKVRKAFAIIAILLGSLLFLTASLIGILHIKSVQTYIIGKVTDRLEKELNIDIDIAQFHYRPLSHLTIDGVYFSDQKRDTLMYVKHIQMEFEPLDLLNNRINIQKLQLQEPYINLQTAPDSTLNCQFLIDYFKRDSGKSSLQLNIDMLQLNQARVRYNDILVDQVDLTLGLPILSADSLDVQLHSLHLRAQLDRLDARFEANLHGNLDSIVAKDMNLIFRDQQIFAGNLAVYHPTNLDSLSISAECEHMFCNNTLLQDMLSQLQMHPVELPKIVNNLGDIQYRGSINGRLENLDLHGIFTTNLGSINVNGIIQTDTTFKNFDFSGHVSTPSFQLGHMLSHKDFGTLAVQAHVDGKIQSSKFVSCVATADIQKIQFKDYTYHNIHLDGKMQGEEVQGHFSIADENIHMDINGLVDWSQLDTRLDFNMQVSEFQPSKLHLTKQYPDLKLAGTTRIDLRTFGKGYEILDNLTGRVIIDTLTIENGEKTTTMEQMKLFIDTEHKSKKNAHQIRIQSDYLIANLDGTFQYHTLPATIRRILHEYIPTLVPSTTKKTKQKNDLDFYAHFRNLEELSQVFNWDISLPASPIVNGFIHESSDQINLQVYIPQIKTTGSTIENMTVSLDNEDDQLELSVYLLNNLPENNVTAAKIGDITANLLVTAQDDEVDLSLALGNANRVRNEGIIQATSKLSRHLGKPKFDIQLLPTDIILNDSAWHIGSSNITYSIAEQTLDIENFSLSTDYQSIVANGRASKSSQDSIDISLNNININYILSYTGVNNAFSILGLASGNARLYSVFSEPMVEAQACIRNGGLNGVYFGDVTAEAKLDRLNKKILISGQIVDSTQHVVATVDGNVVPADKHWWLDINCDSLDINFIDYWTEGIVANPQGRGYGSIKIDGEDQQVWITGRVLAKDAQLTVPDIGVTFYFTDSVFIDSTCFRFPDITMYDQYGNPGKADGIVRHNHFTNFTYDLHAYADNILAMDLPEEPQAFFYGKVFGGGKLIKKYRRNSVL